MGFPSDRDLLAGRGHHESDAEFYGRIAVPVQTPDEPEAPSVNIKVSIPVEIGGYTGQREQWESTQNDYNVAIEDDGRVLLESTRPGGRKLWLDLAELNEAVEFVRSREGGRQ